MREMYDLLGLRKWVQYSFFVLVLITKVIYHLTELCLNIFQLLMREPLKVENKVNHHNLLLKLKVEDNNKYFFKTKCCKADSFI